MNHCKVNDCLREAHAKELCPAHYQRAKKGGNLTLPIKVFGEHRSYNPLYGNYKAMHQRCDNPKSKYYAYYGGRGITVCERWSGPDGFKNFQEDMGEKPESLTIDRIDNMKGYSPDNCRWATRTTQQINQRISTVNTSGHKGVSLHKATGRWSAHVYQKRRKIHLGYFTTKEDAIAARISAELSYYE